MVVNSLGYISGLNGYGQMPPRAQGQEEQEGIAARAQGYGGAKSGGSSDLLHSIRGKVRDILDEIEPSDGKRLRMEDVTAHRDKLLEEFQGKVKSDLLALGVDPDIEFSLGMSADGGKLTVSSQHPQKEVVEKYLQSDSNLVKEFERIKIINDLARYAQAGKSPSEIIKEVQADLLKYMQPGDEDWFAPSTLHLRMTTQGLSTMNGLSVSV